MNTLREDNAKALEKFADVLKRVVINLKENDRQSDLKDGTLYTIILEKIPEKLLAQHYRWIKENQEHESFEKLKDWIAEEAEYRIQAAEIRNGIGSDTKTREKKVPWKRREDSTKSFVSTSGGVETKIQRCKLCGHSHPIWHCDVFKEDQWRDDGKLLSAWGSAIDVCVTIILETRVQVIESAKSMVARILITDYFMQKELLHIEKQNVEVQTEQSLNQQWRTTKQKQPSRKAEGVPVMLIRHI